MSWVAGNVEEFTSVGKGKSSRKAKGNVGKFSPTALSTAPGSIISTHRSSSDDSAVVSEGLVRRHAGSGATDDILDRSSRTSKSYSSGSASSRSATPRTSSSERSDGSPHSAEIAGSPHSAKSGSSERRREERREEEKKEKRLLSDAFDNYSLFQESKDSAGVSSSGSPSAEKYKLRESGLSSWSKEPSWVFDSRGGCTGLEIEEHQPYVSVLEYLIRLLKDLDRYDYAIMFSMLGVWCVAMFMISRYLPARIEG